MAEEWDRHQKSVVSPPNNIPYVLAVVVMSLIGVASIVLISIFRSDKDNSNLITMIIGLITPTTLSLLAFMKAQETHLSVNSRLDSFMLNAREAAHAQGFVQGKAEGIAVADARTDKLKEDSK